MDSINLLATITTKKNFLSFLKIFRSEFGKPDIIWSNDTLQAFLDGLEGYCQDTQESEEPSWHEFAEILAAARNYE